MKKPRNPILRTVGAHIRILRQSAKLSQEKLALKAGLDRSYIGGVERGERNISVLNLYRLADTLQIKPSQILPPLPAAAQK